MKGYIFTKNKIIKSNNKRKEKKRKKDRKKGKINKPPWSSPRRGLPAPMRCVRSMMMIIWASPVRTPVRQPGWKRRPAPLSLSPNPPPGHHWTPGRDENENVNFKKTYSSHNNSNNGVVVVMILMVLLILILLLMAIFINRIKMRSFIKLF